MAFSVTPTSGAGPYNLSATFSDQLGFDYGSYVLRFYSATTLGSCVSSALPTDIQNPLIAQSLVETGTAVVSDTTEVGSCSTFTIAIFTASGDYVSELSVTVNNV